MPIDLEALAREQIAKNLSGSVEQLVSFARQVVLPKVLEIVELDAESFRKRFPDEWESSLAVDRIIGAAIRREFGVDEEKS